MSAVPGAVRARTEHPSGVLGAALIAAASAALLVAADLPTADAPAHLYRTLLVRDGAPVWDNLWYGGHYPLASYSLLYYLPAALVGNLPLVVAAAVVSAALFASIVHREWPDAGPWPARVFAILLAGPIFTGTYSYALGLAALLGTLRALQAGRTWVAVACAALALGFSPLAFVLLCLVLAGLLLARRRAGRRTLWMACAVGGLVALEIAALTLFPYDGVYPFTARAMLASLGVAVLGCALSLRSRRAAPLAAFFVCWAAASAGAYAVQTPVGANLVRVQLLVFPLMLLAALLAGMRPRWLVVLALGAAFAYNAMPYALMATQRVGSVYRDQAAWSPALTFLRVHSAPDFRVEVVPTAEHWEAYYVPAAGFALARGWYRQLDLAQNPLLYRQAIPPRAYRAWLRSLGIRYVLLPSADIDSLGARAEAALLESGRSGLRVAFADGRWTIFELPRPTPILSGPAPARLTDFGHTKIAGWTAAPGRYRLRVRYMRYWQLAGGNVCVARGADGSTVLVSHRRGRFALASDEGPGQVLENMAGAASAVCRDDGRAAS